MAHAGDETPWVGGGLEEGGSGIHKNPMPQLFGKRRGAFQLCICCIQGEGFSKPAPLQRPVNGKRAAFKPNCSQPYDIHNDGLKLLI